MDLEEFRSEAHRLVDWMADYLEEIRDYPVKPGVRPGEILGALPEEPPEKGEPFPAIFSDFRETILPGITHWQHPSFFAYFPANSSPPSVLAEMLTATLGAQCMSWLTSPAATELEERVMGWLGKMIGLPGKYTGVIQDTASTSTLVSLITAREKATGFGVNERGFETGERFTIYGSTETHSSIEKAVKIAGFGRESFRKVGVDENFALLPGELEKAVRADLEAGFRPLAVVGTLGTTGSTAMDPLKDMGEICRRYGLWFHVDAAFAGTALMLPEFRHLGEGLEYADTFVFNPHKWMLTNFDCSAYFVRDEEALVRTFEILPEYLKTPEGRRVKNYRDWGIALGRRFRALKLWFVIRSYGVEGIREILRRHIEIARCLEEEIRGREDFEILAPRVLNLLCFRYHPPGEDDPERLNALNERLLQAVNETGKAFLSHTKLRGAYTIRMVTGQTQTTLEDALAAWELILRLAGTL
ncbi:MAG TPA: aspartate aminotransferase family protein [Planctomycetes bacterium]|nr:aspartate aminotransferase family protein [Planctomycetota bacterium]